MKNYFKIITILATLGISPLYAMEEGGDLGRSGFYEGSPLYQGYMWDPTEEGEEVSLTESTIMGEVSERPSRGLESHITEEDISVGDRWLAYSKVYNRIVSDLLEWAIYEKRSMPPENQLDLLKEFKKDINAHLDREIAREQAEQASVEAVTVRKR